VAIPPATDPIHLALVVVTDPALKQLCCETLPEIGFTVANGIESGADTLVRTRVLRPDVILLSHQLSDVPARQAVRWLRANPESAATPIVVLGGRASDAQNDAGVIVLPRPVTADALRMAMSNALGPRA
jgi:DNA-binding response OmpR family regulator